MVEPATNCIQAQYVGTRRTVTKMKLPWIIGWEVAIDIATTCDGARQLVCIIVIINVKLTKQTLIQVKIRTVAQILTNNHPLNA